MTSAIWSKPCVFKMLEKIKKLARPALLVVSYLTLVLFLLEYAPFIASIHFEKDFPPPELSGNIDIALSITSGIINSVFQIIIIINVIVAIVYFRQNDAKNAYNNMKKIKLYLIPYWIISFITAVIITVFTQFMGGIFFGLAILVQSYLFLITTSCYSIAFLGILIKAKQIPKSRFFIHGILQLCFVLDVVDTIHLLHKYDISRPLVS